MIPSQKFGIDTPPSEAPLASMSQTVLRRTAASTPAGIAMPTRDEQRQERELDRDRQLGGDRVDHATPACGSSGRGRRGAPAPTQRRYWIGIGSPSPYFSRIASMPAASASVPAITRAGSPGIMRTPVKTTMLMTKRVTTEIAARLDQKVEHRRRRLPGQFQDVPLIRIRPSGTPLYPFRFLGNATM